MCAIPVFFTGQCPWNPNASTIVLFCFCQIIANYQKHESNDQISEQSNIHIYSKSNSIARAHNNRGKCSHEPHKCPDQLRTDVLRFGSTWVKRKQNHIIANIKSGSPKTVIALLLQPSGVFPVEKWVGIFVGS